MTICFDKKYVSHNCGDCRSPTPLLPRQLIYPERDSDSTLRALDERAAT